MKSKKSILSLISTLSLIFLNSYCKTRINCPIVNEILINNMCCPKFGVLDETGENCRCKANEEAKAGECVCKSGFKQIVFEEGVGKGGQACCRADQIFDKDSGCHCPPNTIDVDDSCRELGSSASKECPCPPTLVFHSGSCQCPYPEVQTYSEATNKCECNRGYEIKGSKCCLINQELDPETNECKCQGDMKVIVNIDGLPECACPSGKSKSRSHPFTCCDESIEINRNGKCECKGDLIRNSLGVCECPFGTENNSINATKCCREDQVFDTNDNECICKSGLLDFGTKCCPSDRQLNIFGNCVCKGELESIDGFETTLDAKTTCKCPDSLTQYNETLCCPDDQEGRGSSCVCKGNKVFGLSSATALQCVCPQGTIPKPNEDSQHCCLPDQTFNEDAGKCECVGDLVLGIDRCICPPNTILFGFTRCCRKDQQFNKLTDSCECKYPLMDFEGRCTCNNGYFTDDGTQVCCDEGLIYSEVQKRCIYCEDDTYFSKGSCERCKYGYQLYKDDSGRKQCKMTWNLAIFYFLWTWVTCTTFALISVGLYILR
ncbi:MAG: hypothetical protein MHMPM18_000151 [Marteilia pararefringens]